ncbi:MAG: glycosyltransferase [Conexivisphaerales archaeon]
MKVAFIFDRKTEYPPDFNNIKAYYVTRFLLKKGVDAVWIQRGHADRKFMLDGIEFVELSTKKVRIISFLFYMFRVAFFCTRNQIDTVYADDWLFMRNGIAAKIIMQFVLRLIRIKWVTDARDPLVDFGVATGLLREDSMLYKIKAVLERIYFASSDLLILPSRAYAQLVSKQGIKKNTLGIFRGIDPSLFKPSADGNSVRRTYNIEDSFVIGWFGMMYRHLLVEEIILKLASELHNIIPDAYLLVGGKGPLKKSLEKTVKEGNAPNLIYVGLVPYNLLPKYISACDVLLCPVSTKSRFSLHSAWLKIPEALAVGRPVIASRTFVSLNDFKELKGVEWTGSTFQDFVETLQRVRLNISRYRRDAEEQAKNFSEYSIDSSMLKITNAIIKLIKDGFNKH